MFLQAGTDVAAAQAQVASISQTVLKQLPAGITPPEVLAQAVAQIRPGRGIILAGRESSCV